MKMLVSACLLGEKCRYDGHSKPCDPVLELKKHHTLIPVCPEILGGLKTPREPSEIRNGRVYSKNGTDLTEHFVLGAIAVLKIATHNGCRTAILKERSPSCGKGKIYDGSFCGKLVEGDGYTASLLSENGISVYGETYFTDCLSSKI